MWNRERQNFMNRQSIFMIFIVKKKYYKESKQLNVVFGGQSRFGGMMKKAISICK